MAPNRTNQSSRSYGCTLFDFHLTSETGEFLYETRRPIEVHLSARNHGITGRFGVGTVKATWDILSGEYTKFQIEFNNNMSMEYSRMKEVCTSV